MTSVSGRMCQTASTVRTRPLSGASSVTTQAVDGRFVGFTAVATIPNINVSSVDMSSKLKNRTKDSQI